MNTGKPQFILAQPAWALKLLYYQYSYKYSQNLVIFRLMQTVLFFTITLTGIGAHYKQQCHTLCAQMGKMTKISTRVCRLWLTKGEIQSHKRSMPLYNRGSTTCLSISPPNKNKQTTRILLHFSDYNPKSYLVERGLRAVRAMTRQFPFSFVPRLSPGLSLGAHPVVPRESHLCPCTREELKDWVCVWNMVRKNPFLEMQTKPKQDRSVSGTDPVKGSALVLSQVTNN